MKSFSLFGLLILVASITLVGMTNNIYAQDDTGILLKIAKHTQEQIQKQISIDSSDQVNILFEDGTQKVSALEQSLKNDDANSAKEYFLSAMKIFTQISRQLTVPDDIRQTEIDHVTIVVQDPSNHLQRLQAYVNNLKIITEKHNISIDFSEQDKLFVKAKQQISLHQFSSAIETLHTIKETTTEINKKLRAESSIQESQRAKEYAQKYLEQLDRLIENAKKQNVNDDIIVKLELAKQNLSSAQNPHEIVKEIRNILLIKNKYELTNNDILESKVLQIEKNLSKLYQIDTIDQNNLNNAKTTLQNIKFHLYEGEFDIADVLLKNLTKQLEEIKNSL